MTPTTRIEVSDIGPIASGSIDLRRLNVFVGPNDAGKSYLATLLYALSRSLRGFPRCPSSSSLPAPPFDPSQPDSPSAEEWIRLAKSLATRDRTVRLNDFPSIFRTHAESHLKRVLTGERGLQSEIEHCFELNSILDLVRWTEAGTDACISVAVNDGRQDLWSFKVGIGNRGELSSNSYPTGDVVPQAPRSDPPVSSQYQIENPSLMLPTGREFDNNSLLKLLHSISRSENCEVVNEIYSKARDVLNYNSIPRGTYFIPAARSGIMQSFDVLDSSFLAHLHATRPGLEWFPTPEKSSGMIAVFLTDLLWREQSLSQNTNPLNQVADELEQGFLGGAIRRPIGNLGGSSEQDPRFVYVPNHSDKQLRIRNSPSMASELASLVLYLRQNVLPHDTLIIEEPEAHLHPESQTRMAVILAKLARAGVRVVVTTHSDWLLKQLGNLIRQAELDTGSDSTGYEDHNSGAIQAKDVGIWWFEDGGSGGSTIREIPYDRSDGVEPTEFADVDEELYNKSADLQNLLEDREQESSL